MATGNSITRQTADVPVYNNVGYPFHNNPPFIKAFDDNFDKNPVGSYRRNFTLPENWKDGRRVFIHFDGACSAIVVWVNGQYAGYSQGANTDAEFGTRIPLVGRFVS